MGVNKKPAVIAKTAKRGRPVGSKNKKKTLADYPIGAAIPSDDFFEALERSVDWEKLAKQLQEALAHEMKLNERYERAAFTQRIKFLFTGRV